jgi:hypothetical protein
MRYECTRSDAATKWYEVNLLSIGQNLFAVTAVYGVKGPSGEDQVLQGLCSIFAGSYLEALDHLSEKVKDRESIGYVKIEPKTNT